MSRWLSGRWWVPVLVGALGFGALGCGRSAVDLEAARRLEGDWELVLRRDARPLPGDAAGAEVAGTIALLANREGVRVGDFPGVPLNVGVHDLHLAGIAPGVSTGGVPGVAGSVRGDSAVLVIAPGTRQPLTMRGHLAGDSITGRWATHQRAAVSATGTFVMRRR